MAKTQTYPASFDVDYPARLDRTSTLFRLFWAIPILIVLFALTASGGEGFMEEGRDQFTSGGGIVGGLSVATALVIIFRQRYPRWWFDFALELNRFTSRIAAYMFLLTDKYPSTVDKQTVHLNITYPDAKRDLNRWLPLVKWFLAIPHYVVLAILVLAAMLVTIIAWFSILFTETYPKSLFDFVVGVNRYGIRVTAYAFMLTTDKYPPFSID